MRPNRLFLVIALLAAGCQSVPASTTAARPDATSLSRTSQLAHDGGIVFGTSLEGIAPLAKRETAATLSTSLGAALRAERAMRDAEFLVDGGALSAPKAYRLLSTEETDEETSFEVEPGPQDSPPSDDLAQEDELERDEEELAENEALQAWRDRADEERERARQDFERRKEALREALAENLARRAKAFRIDAERSEATAGGGREVHSTLTRSETGDRRTIEVTHKYDAAGVLFQTVQRLQGQVGAVTYSAKRTRTFLPDGTIRKLAESTITFDGKSRVVRQETKVAADGTTTTTGTLTRPDGAAVQLSGGGKEGGMETLVAKDAETGLSITIEAAASTGVARTIVDAGADGTVTLELDTDEDDAED